MSNPRYEWLARLKVNGWSIECNEHACSYVTASKWIEDHATDWFADTPPELIEGMKNSNTVFRLQIYPDTPIGFYFWYGPTLDSVIDQAMHAEGKEPSQ